MGGGGIGRVPELQCLFRLCRVSSLDLNADFRLAAAAFQGAASDLPGFSHCPMSLLCAFFSPL